MFNSEAKMMREISALKKEIQTIKDEQIKQRRDNNDAMYNLDSDNVPDLAGVVKEIRLIVKDGKVSGAFIISAINADESGAQLVASHINLDGATITLNGKKGITITSPNFKVDKQGNVTCNNATMNNATMNNATMNNATMNNAQIKRSCVLASDIGVGEAMKIGKTYVDRRGNSSLSDMYLEDFYDTARWGNIRGLVFETLHKRNDNDGQESGDEKSKVNINPQRLVLEIETQDKDMSDYFNLLGAVGLKRGWEREKVYAYMYTKGNNESGMGNYLWIDPEGNLCTTAKEILFEQGVPGELME